MFPLKSATSAGDVIWRHSNLLFSNGGHHGSAILDFLKKHLSRSGCHGNVELHRQGLAIPNCSLAVLVCSLRKLQTYKVRAGRIRPSPGLNRVKQEGHTNAREITCRAETGRIGTHQNSKWQRTFIDVCEFFSLGYT